MIRLAVRVARAHADDVLEQLMELSPGGLEEREVDDDTVEYAIYGAPGELPALPDLRAAAGGALVDVSTTELPDGWDGAGATGTRRSTSTVPAGASACARRGPTRAQGAIDVVIDPGPGVRHRAAPHDAGCAWSCCWSSSRPGRSPTGAAARASSP